MNKSEQRKEIKKRLEALEPGVKSRMSADICDRLRKLCEDRKGVTLLSYMPSENEADVSPFNAYFRELGNTVAYPVCGDDGKMSFYAPGRDGIFLAGRYGIMEPDPGCSEPVEAGQADIILVPCVAFTEDLKRLGHGGGYYDRYLAGCASALKILVAFSVQEETEIETEPHDIPVDLAVTDSGIIGKYNTGGRHEQLRTENH